MAEDAFAVSYLRHDMRGAPVINGNTPGCMIAALDALLVTGWGPAAPQSLTVSAGVATATFASATPWEVGAVIKISDATPEAINGKARVLSSSGNTLTFATSASAGTYSGTIDIRYCPADWEKVFSATNKAVYRSKDPLGNRHYLRVDDGDVMRAKVCGYVSMSSIDTGTECYPEDGRTGGGGFWVKSAGSGITGASPYLLAADSVFLVLCVARYVPYWGSGRSVSDIRGFGDFLSMSPIGDAYASGLSATTTVPASSAYGSLAGSIGQNDSLGVCALPRGFGAEVGCVHVRTFPLTGREGDISGDSNLLGICPSPVSGKVILSRVAIRSEGYNGAVRAMIPGVFYIPQTGALGSLGANFAINPGAGDVADRQLATVHQAQSVEATPVGVALVDVTGPWR